jgi:uncharacterized repeat protein (TIGR01451 family)
MRPLRVRLALVLALATLPTIGLSGARADHEPEIIEVTPANSPQTWQGDTATGTNVNYDFSAGEPCHESPPADPEYCDIRLLRVNVPANFWDAQAGGIEVRLDGYVPPGSDFDLQIFESDEHGTKGRLVASSGNPPSQAERTTITEPSGYYLMQIVYFAVVSGTYTGTAELFFRDRTPPDVDVPPGLQEILASETAAGWTSRSEMHIAQSPADPNILVAGSKFYNKDPDALGEYEFKVGTYVSFDRGVTWTDLGQLATCPASQAGPDTWPNNTCYPAEDPTADGTGLEDATAGPGATVNVASPSAPVTVGEHIEGTEFSDSRPLTEGSVGPAPVFAPDDGAGCAWASATASGLDPWIGLTPRAGTGSCPTFQAKFTAATAAGADGLIVINTDDTDPPDEGTAVAEIPGILVTQSDGQRLQDSISPGNPNKLQVTLQIPRGPDFGEEYITSDPWAQFDDEGNAYFMVLDAPPFQSGVGWGMTLHKWESVSPEDVASGTTWSERIPINKYPDDFPRDFLGFLDDKNTFAVNNAGGDGDGTTGTLIACWGQNVSGVIKQQIVCERSTDGGESWPSDPVPVSGVHQLVIGVHVIADKGDPDTFYAVWLQYETTIPTGLATVEFARTIDGGLTWQPPVEVGIIDDIPRTFPRQGFRNLSIPIMAVGPPPAGDLYVAVAEYLDAPEPATDEDDKQADIVLFKSTNGGTTWSKSNVTEYDGTSGVNPNADQFQPYIDVTQSGQLNAIYFDRRHDLPQGLHPGNYFTDVYLSRSNDGGGSWTDTRLTHDATDPEFNAPVSGSGLFFGDYQGLVADDCAAIPFVNDTHLANDEFLDPGPVRDPDFDDGLPSDPYQQAINWFVPNTPALGGPAGGPSGECPASLSVTKTDSPDPAHIGQPLTYTIVVKNAGPGEAEQVTAIDALPRQAGFGTVTTTQGTCTHKPKKRTVECNLGTLAAGGSATITIEVKPTRKGTITNTVDVSSPSDPDSPVSARADTQVLP